MSTKTLTSLLLMAALTTLSGCAGSRADDETAETSVHAILPPAEQAAALQTAAQSANTFAFDLFGRLHEPQDNLFFSPASIAIALTMTWAGAEGPTAVEMADALHLTDDPATIHAGFAQLQDQLTAQDKPYTLRVANRLWGQAGFGFLDDFLRTLRQNYGAGLETLDFRKQPETCRRIINDWVAEQTEQKIQDLLPQGTIDQLTRLVLTNAVYFLADWEHPFPVEATADEDFHLTGGATLRVPTMKTTRQLPYAETETWQVLTLPYEGGELEFVVLLPRTDVAAKQPEQHLTAALLQRLLAQRRGREVSCWLPSFKLETAFDLNAPLQDLGMKTAFDQERADFSGMTGRDDLFISAVVHKAFIEVDEKGTEAAAATGVVMSLKSAMPPRPVEFRADHPFVFLIRHIASENVLFLGYCANPQG